MSNTVGLAHGTSLSTISSVVTVSPAVSLCMLESTVTWVVGWLGSWTAVVLVAVVVSVGASVATASNLTAVVILKWHDVVLVNVGVGAG